MDKKGITKVMIIGLIVVLVLAVSLFVYFFFFGPPVEEAECGVGTNWKVLSVAGKEDFCYNQQKQEIRFTVENGLTTSLEGIYVKVEAEQDKADKYFDEAKLDKAGVFIGKVPFDLIKDGPLTKVQLFPVVLIEDAETACIDEVIEIEALENCS